MLIFSTPLLPATGLNVMLATSPMLSSGVFTNSHAMDCTVPSKSNVREASSTSAVLSRPRMRGTPLKMPPLWPVTMVRVSSVHRRMEAKGTTTIGAMLTLQHKIQATAYGSLHLKTIPETGCDHAH